MSRAGAASGLFSGDGSERREAPRVGARWRRCPAPPRDSPLLLRTAPRGACALPSGGLPSWLTWSGLRSAGEVDALGHRRYCGFGRGGSAQKPLPWRPSPPRCLKPPAASRGSPGPLLSSQPPGLVFCPSRPEGRRSQRRGAAGVPVALPGPSPLPGLLGQETLGGGRRLRAASLLLSVAITESRVFVYHMG